MENNKGGLHTCGCVVEGHNTKNFGLWRLELVYINWEQNIVVEIINAFSSAGYLMAIHSI